MRTARWDGSGVVLDGGRGRSAGKSAQATHCFTGTRQNARIRAVSGGVWECRLIPCKDDCSAKPGATTAGRRANSEAGDEKTCSDASAVDGLGGVAGPCRRSAAEDAGDAQPGGSGEVGRIAAGRQAHSPAAPDHRALRGRRRPGQARRPAQHADHGLTRYPSDDGLQLHPIDRLRRQVRAAPRHPRELRGQGGPRVHPEAARRPQMVGWPPLHHRGLPLLLGGHRQQQRAVAFRAVRRAHRRRQAAQGRDHR